ncbi:glycoside hydrolase family 19 protein [Micromonospora sp. NBC_01796]|uniref:glycoside hydrolase family 19 protein n=1 Tax=Micromonospora sp. NBC_01796 TaxID=2975987 RepID=UPI002DDBF790|nr:glycoside hydrolase family 19 protein [Micromonospora sp. NBC_01796]WSA84168.1 carbohydrate-binding protein [Micromonospora sp. NBC_01796]
MLRLRALVTLAALVVAGGLVAIIPSAPASAAACAASWQASTVYWGGNQASHNGRNYQAKWWTQNEAPPGTTGVWQDLGACDGGTTPPPGGGCNHPNWTAGTWYPAGSIVRYTNGLYYIAEHENPGYDPIVSTWYWEPYTCGGQPPTTPPPTNPGGFVVTEAQFNQMFPGRNSFYTYSGLVAALSAYSAFARTGSATVQRQEAAAFLANVYHETGGLVHIVEQNQANYPHYCDAGQPYGCPAGQAAYYGRGPIQLSWNFNYNAAGNALGLPLLTNPWLVQNDAAVAWKTGIWYWMTQNGPGTMTPHNAMVNGAGFGETIRSINGSIECNGGNPPQVQSRVTRYQQFVGILGVPAGNNLYC